MVSTKRCAQTRFFFSCPLIMIESFTQNVLYVYFSGFLSNRKVFNNSVVGNFSSMFFLRSTMIRLFTFALIIPHDRSFNIENFLWESSIMVLPASTWLLILLLKHDSTADNSSDAHAFFNSYLSTIHLFTLWKKDVSTY